MLLLLASINFSYSENENRRTYCGRILAEALAKLCGDDLMLLKRTNLYDGVIMKRYGASDSWPWIKTQGDMENRAKRQGIVDECCHQPCDVATLLAYC